MNLHVGWRWRGTQGLNGGPRPSRGVLYDDDAEPTVIVWQCEHAHPSGNTGPDRATACAAAERDRRERAENLDD